MRLKPLRRIGEGTFSAVFLCRRTRTGEFFAVKVLKKAHVGGQGLPLEVKLLEQLQHPHIIRLHEHFITGGGGGGGAGKRKKHRARRRGKGGDSLLGTGEPRVCLVLDYCERGTLFETIRRAKAVRSSNGHRTGGMGLTLAVACDLLRGLLSALAHLHDAGWVHRDVKPENILVRETGGESSRLEAVLADLGSCRREPTCPPAASVAAAETVAVSAAAAAAPAAAVEMTEKTAPFATDYIGTRWYRSPE